MLFTGSIRENLAPFGGHSDSALWSALRRAHLAPVVEDWAAEGLGGLDFVLGEGGSPLSAGQKQLLALARALLNPAKVRAGVGRAGWVCAARIIFCREEALLSLPLACLCLPPDAHNAFVSPAGPFSRLFLHAHGVLQILVLDEATANVDVETDALIQETLRSEFGDRTLLAVAHRLHTVIESDRWAGAVFPLPC